MDTLRRRIPSKREEEEVDENVILDEQQQEALIEGLRKDNEVVNRRYAAALKAILSLSCILQISAFNRNPLLVNYTNTEKDPSIPLPAVFTLLSLFIHLNLALFFYSDAIRIGLQLSESLTPLSYQLLYSLSAVAPTLSLFLRKPWQTTAWWSITLVVIFVVQAVMDAIQQSIQGIADLDNMKYVAPGA
ncbi:hypothetical protein HYPSUDRAFT_141085 [Hypholoma sublateritium FD-334 SS-4]|uniref:Uncharacterized protein n=1 Tax=Hypholoma sublateritium (strain FD-334 SS-4) TaxID=945553 RepID=A0A0D2MCQ5_HYPSF|nr:hypothetical protein HYPSUDRAFT_141085 [Hypholoma sublateritium FD-334 SS-4]